MVVTTRKINVRRGRGVNSKHQKTDVLSETQNVAGTEVDLNSTLLTKEKVIDEKSIQYIYDEELLGTQFNQTRILILEVNQYLEKHLWPMYNETSSAAHVISIVLMVNEKMRDRLDAWSIFDTFPEHFQHLFHKVLSLILQESNDFSVSIHLIAFLTNCFGSLENILVRRACLKLTSLGIWHELIPERRDKELQNSLPIVRKHWRYLEKQWEEKEKHCKVNSVDKDTMVLERSFLSKLLVSTVNHIYVFSTAGAPLPAHQRIYLARVFELFIDLESKLPTRRYFNVLLDDHQFLAHSHMSGLFCQNMSTQDLLVQHPLQDVFIEPATQDTYLSSMLSLLEFYSQFEIRDATGLALSREEMTRLHAERLVALQKLTFEHFRDKLQDLALLQIHSLEKRETLAMYFNRLTQNEVDKLCRLLAIRDSKTVVTGSQRTKFVLQLEHIISMHTRRVSPWQRIQSLPILPDERLIWHEEVSAPVALPKLNLQFLTMYDYLLRHFTLYRLESAYEIRQDIEDVLRRMKIRELPESQETNFLSAEGWARMGLMVTSSQVVDIGKPSILDEGVKKKEEASKLEGNELYADLASLADRPVEERLIVPIKIDGQLVPRPSFVKLDVSFQIRNIIAPLVVEWDSLVVNDLVVLVCLAGKDEQNKSFTHKTMASEYRVNAVRGGIFEGYVKNGRLVDMYNEQEVKQLHGGSMRTVRLRMDAAQYQRDLLNENIDIYHSFNIIIRRAPQTNNFKATLESLCDLMQHHQDSEILPAWLHDVFLGYGDPRNACADIMKEHVERTYDMVDTFVTFEHLRTVIPSCSLDDLSSMNSADGTMNYRLQITRRVRETDPVSSHFLPECKVIATPYKRPLRTFSGTKRNPVPFTATQVEAILAGMSPGLTLIVGPPGTGKTDVAVQIVSNLYHHTSANEHILLLTHSNQALNALFEKIMVRDVDERHLLRLGHGEEDLKTEKDFSKIGRVEALLERRVSLLDLVQRLSTSLGIPGDYGATCETALQFFSCHVSSRWDKYLQQQREIDFPFQAFFENEIRANPSVDKKELYADLLRVFDELSDLRALELLPHHRERNKYLLTKQARIVAMTVTHAALKRKELIEANFQYTSIVMEEAAQILEIETFLPWLLQQNSAQQLQRIILIGDHQQLPPIVQNQNLIRACSFDQSLFSRCIRLGIPAIQLDAQGRARDSLARLYAWRYAGLTNLPGAVIANANNAGFKFDSQFIDVEDYRGHGETSPAPHFYQNLGEAEWMVSVYMYMICIGYPADKIALLTTYNGQKHLIKDIVRARCSHLPKPSAISTVDKYQGQQCDYILLSLVRTKHVGHIRDIRRLIVAVSRARLGLYVFGRASLFSRCFELQTVMGILNEKPMRLQLVENERYDDDRSAASVDTREIKSADEMSALLNEIQERDNAMKDSQRAGEDSDEDMLSDSGTSSNSEQDFDEQ